MWSPTTTSSLLLIAALLVRASSQADTDTDTDSTNTNSGSGVVWVTPHEQFSSSAGVLGCKIDTNRVAYWPGAVSCDDLCVRLSREGRSVELLRVDTSQGAHDVSYDAWNYLYTGYPAAERPATGGALAADFEYLDPAECAGLIRAEGNRLPLSAPTGTSLLAACLAARPDSWVARNHALYNIVDPVCAWGFDEECALDYPAANQAACPHALGLMEPLASAPVYNVQYGTGKTVLASTGQVVEDGAAASGGSGVGGVGVKGLNGAIASSAYRLWSLLGSCVLLQCLLLGFI